eukprot:894235-Pyramimonas_sp.AAC.1
MQLPSARARTSGRDRVGAAVNTNIATLLICTVLCCRILRRACYILALPGAAVLGGQLCRLLLLAILRR